MTEVGEKRGDFSVILFSLMFLEVCRSRLVEVELLLSGGGGTNPRLD